MSNYSVSRSSAEHLGSRSIGALKADSTTYCVLKAIRQLAPDSEPWRVRLSAQEMRGKVITDGAFFAVIHRLKAQDHIRMVRHEPRPHPGDTSRDAEVGIYQVTERGHTCLTAADNRDVQPWWHWPATSLGLLPGTTSPGLKE